jgi:hypothetical protein
MATVVRPSAGRRRRREAPVIRRDRTAGDRLDSPNGKYQWRGGRLMVTERAESVTTVSSGGQINGTEIGLSKMCHVGGEE